MVRRKAVMRGRRHVTLHARDGPSGIGPCDSRLPRIDSSWFRRELATQSRFFSSGKMGHHDRWLTRYAVRAQPDRSSASRQRADGAVQLPRCARWRWPLRAAYRGHRRRPQPAGAHRAAARRSAMAGSRLGRGSGPGRPARAVPAERARRSLRGGDRDTACDRSGLSMLLHARRAEPRAARSARGGSSPALRRDLRRAFR